VGLREHHFEPRQDDGSMSLKNKFRNFRGSLVIRLMITTGNKMTKILDYLIDE